MGTLHSKLGDIKERVQKMRPSEHVAAAGKFLVDADREYEAGDALQDSELMVGPFGYHSPLKRAMPSSP